MKKKGWYVDLEPETIPRCEIQTRRHTRCQRRAMSVLAGSTCYPELVGRYRCRQHTGMRLGRLRWW